LAQGFGDISAFFLVRAVAASAFCLAFRASSGANFSAASNFGRFWTNTFSQTATCRCKAVGRNLRWQTGHGSNDCATLSGSSIDERDQDERFGTTPLCRTAGGTALRRGEISDA